MVLIRAAESIIPSSFRNMDDKLLDEIAALDGAERIEYILDKCFSIKADIVQALPNGCDFPLVEIEEDLFVLELESAKSFVSIDTKIRASVIASVLLSSYIDLAVDDEVDLFLPYDGVNIDLVDGALLANSLGAPFKVFVGASKKDINKQEVTCYEIDGESVKELIKDFSDFDDYVFDPVSVLAAGAYDCVENDGIPSVVVSIASPMQYAKEVLSALGVKARDEQEARIKLEDLFAVEPIDE